MMDDSATPEELEWTADTLQQAQQEDMEIKDICTWLAAAREPPRLDDVTPLSGTVRTYLQQWPVLQLRDGILHRRWETADELQTIWQWIPPVLYRRGLIQLTHEGMTGGHLGIARTQNPATEADLLGELEGRCTT